MIRIPLQKFAQGLEKTAAQGTAQNSQAKPGTAQKNVGPAPAKPNTVKAEASNVQAKVNTVQRRQFAAKDEIHDTE
ncbi:unnamed protein product [Strongylus vulgaris]|uniref:Uncharacterized protein n=1 Tax=Strongylus vulgaris TaxID=40348 RepID=A0A3P7JRU6_STRVU|nr:unnamed protein product [Strongylus vulgaris]